MSERTTTTLFECHGWAVVASEDPDQPFDLLDDEGDCRESYETLAAAVADCQSEGLSAYRDRLMGEIQSADIEGLETYVLQTIAELMGLDPRTI
jgi:hypothetical protein